MSIPTPSPGGSQPARSEVQRPPADASGALDAELLEQVLKETIAAADAVSSDGEALEILKDVARRHPGSGLTREPVMVDLVQALLKLHFSSLSENVELWRDVSLRIADTLLEDASTHDRLQELWRRVSGTVG